jgi:hypothetical protein
MSISIYLCIYLSMYVSNYVYMYTHTHTHTHTHTYGLLAPCLQARFRRMKSRAHTETWRTHTPCTCVSECVCLCVCVSVCTHARARAHTHTYIYISTYQTQQGWSWSPCGKTSSLTPMRRNKPFRFSLCARVFVCCKGWAGAVWPEEEEEEESGKGGSARMANFQHVVRNVQNCNACGRVQALLLELEEEAEVYREGISKVFPI